MSVKLDLTSIVSSVPKPPYVCLRWWNPNFGSPEVPLQCFHNPSKLSVGKNDCADRKLILLGLSCLQLGKRCYLMGRESRYTHLVVVFESLRDEYHPHPGLLEPRKKLQCIVYVRELYIVILHHFREREMLGRERSRK